MSTGKSDQESLPFIEGGAVLVDTRDALERVLAHRGQDLASFIVDFEARG